MTASVLQAASAIPSSWPRPPELAGFYVDSVWARARGSLVMAEAPTPGRLACTRRLLRRAGDAVAAVSLGGATLGDGEGARILEAACRAGVALVDTSDAYGHSEFVVGLASCGVAVATKYGNPCARNGYAHDWSVAAGRAALDASRAALRGKRLALYQLHSPPADAVTPAVAQVLEAAVTAGEIGGWGASVHSFECGRRCVALGCDALQVPFNVLQQEHAALIDGCRSAGVGVLAQSVLAQGWLTTQGVGVARALLAGRADLLPREVGAGGDGRARVPFRELLRRVAAFGGIADACGSRPQDVAIRFAAHAPGIASALVQVTSHRQLRDLLRSPEDLDRPLDDATVSALVALRGVDVWTWGAPTPRAALRWAMRRRLHPSTGALLASAYADPAAADVARRLANDGFAKLSGAFDAPVLRAALVGAAAARDDAGAYGRSREVVPFGAAERAAGAALAGAVAAAIDAPLFAAAPLAALSLPDAPPGAFGAWVTTHRRGTAGTWAPPSPLDPAATLPGEFAATWHIDHGNGRRGAAPHAFELEDYLASAHVVVLVLLTDVRPDAGPTLLLRGSHRAMGKALAAAPRGLDVRGMHALCAACRAAAPAADVVAATGRAGDVYVLHPLMVHSASVAVEGSPMRCIVNAPQPWARDERGAVVPARAGVRSPFAATMPRAATENAAVRGLIHLVLRAGGAFNARLRAHARIARLLAYLLAGATFWLFDLASGAVRDADASLADVAPRAACPRWSPWPWPCPRRYRGRHEDEARLLGGDAAV